MSKRIILTLVIKLFSRLGKKFVLTFYFSLHGKDTEKSAQT